MKDNRGRTATKSPTSQQNDNIKQNHGTDDGTQDDKEEIFTLEVGRHHESLNQ